MYKCSLTKTLQSAVGPHGVLSHCTQTQARSRHGLEHGARSNRLYRTAKGKISPSIKPPKDGNWVTDTRAGQAKSNLFETGRSLMAV